MTKVELKALQQRAKEAKKQAPKRKGKYNNNPCEADGYRFDSQAERDRYFELRLLLRTGDITELQVHPVYQLQESFRGPNGKRVRAITYEADFSYLRDGQRVTEDVKGVETAAFKIKAKMFLYAYPDIELSIRKV